MQTRPGTNRIVNSTNPLEIVHRTQSKFRSRLFLIERAVTARWHEQREGGLVPICNEAYTHVTLYNVNSLLRCTPFIYSMILLSLILYRYPGCIAIACCRQTVLGHDRTIIAILGAWSWIVVQRLRTVSLLRESRKLAKRNEAFNPFRISADRPYAEISLQPCTIQPHDQL